MTFRSFLTALVGTTLLIWFAVGCVTTPNASRRASRCNMLMPGTLGISANLLELAPGESLQLERPMMFTAPYAPPDSIPANCAVRWSAGPGATISESGLVTIASDAVPGSSVTVRAQVESLVAEAHVLVVDPAPNPLAGMWTQTAGPDCDNAFFQPPRSDAVVRELIFRRGGTFAVTRVPFETFQDFWGTYSYDGATGKLTLDISGGNNVPDIRSPEFIARVAGNELRLDGGVLAGRAASLPNLRCTSVFRKVGGPG